MKIRTIQISNAVKFEIADDPDYIDVTIKSASGIGSYFAPTWGLVSSYKQGNITPEQYKQVYLAKLRSLYRKHKQVFIDLLKRDEVILACYCRPGTFCHRKVLVEVLLAVAKANGISAEYAGEITHKPVDIVQSFIEHKPVVESASQLMLYRSCKSKVIHSTKDCNALRSVTSAVVDYPISELSDLLSIGYRSCKSCCKEFSDVQLVNQAS